MIEQLPVLQILVPMLTAPLCVLLRKSRAAWALALAATWFALATSVMLLIRVMDEGTVRYALGGWRPPWGIELRIDAINAFVLLIVTGISSVVLTAAPRSLDKEVRVELHYLFYAAYLLCMTGLLGMAATGDAFNIFVFLEISSLSSYILIALGPTRRALHSSLQYLIMGTLGGTFILLGVGMLYMVTGTLNLVEMGETLAIVGSNRTVLVALAMIVVGTSIKLALFPLSAWLPNAYTYAPALVTAFLAATATKVAYYVLVRFVYGVFGAELAFSTLRLDAVLMPMALLAMFVASTLAIYEADVKRLLAYSSLAQIGYMVLGLSMASVTGLTGGIVHLFNHALMKSGLFLALACVALRIGSTRLDDMAGLGRRMPWTAAAFVGGGLGLIGVPMTAGFVSKWYLVLAAFEGGFEVLAALILLSSLLAVIYVWRVVEVLYFKERPEGAEPVKEAPWSLLGPTWLLIGATVYFGIFTSASVGVAERAAQILTNGGAP